MAEITLTSTLTGRLAPIGSISPWLDAKTVPEDELLALLERQRHRRFLETHTPLDGLPRRPGVTIVTVIRHPLDVALSFRDHDDNSNIEQADRLLTATSDPPSARPRDRGPREDPEYLRWWPDLWSDLGTEVRHVAAALGAATCEDHLDAVVDAARPHAMRARAEHTAPHAELGLWKDPAAFFRTGGPRPWRNAMTDEEVAHFERWAGDAVDWIERGRAALR